VRTTQSVLYPQTADLCEIDCLADQIRYIDRYPDRLTGSGMVARRTVGMDMKVSNATQPAH
jgi:hypothetical protein